MSALNLFSAIKMPNTPAAQQRWRMMWTERIRRIVQFGFVAFILYSAVVHNLATEDGMTASVDALCPMGGVATLWQFVTSGGTQFVQKTHMSNIVLALGLLIGVLFAGGAFCGWVCPFGAAQDVMNWLRAKLRLKEIHVPEKWDRVLRWGRFLVLALILQQTITLTKLWFADWDPYRTLFGLEWLFKFDLEASWVAYAFVIGTLGISLLVERAWCRYMCPLGGIISLFGNLSFLRIRRNGEACKGCNICEKPCPVKLPVATANTISVDCIGCLACVESCPRPNVLEVQLAPAWLAPFRKRAELEA